MRVVRVHDRPAANKFVLHHLTDIHLGAPDVDEDALKERIRLIAVDPAARWTFGGDIGEHIRPGDKRYSVTAIHERYRASPNPRETTKEHAVELFAPIASKLWGWCDGNHERTSDEYHGGRFGLEVCQLLGKPDHWVGYRGFVSVQAAVTKTQRLPILIDLQHGWQTGRLKGAPHVQAERELSASDADIVLRGHNHQPMAHSFVTLGVSHGGKQSIRPRTRTVINGGTWRRGWRELEKPSARALSEAEGDLWSETKGFRAEPLGGPVLILRCRVGTNGRRADGVRVPIDGGWTHTTIETHVDAHTLGLGKEE